MRWGWIAFVVVIACRDPGARGPAPVAPLAPPVVAAGPAAIGAFTQPPMPSRSPVCQTVSCSGHGRCVAHTRYPYLSGDVNPSCQCDPGFHAYGLACVACTPVGATYDIDLRVARFRGRITWNGRDLPKDLAGAVYLVSEGDVGTRGEVELGRGRFDVDVLAGRYDIVVRASAGYHEETEIVVARGVAIGGTTALDIALPLERVTPRITYAGALPAPGPDQGLLELVHGDDHIWISIARDPVAVYLPRGAFDVTFLPPRRDDPALPAVSSKVRTGVSPERGELVVDVPIVTVTGTVAGLTAPFDPGLSLIAFVPADEVEDGSPPGAIAALSPAFTAVLVRGRYDVWLTTKLRKQPFAMRLAKDVEITGARLDLAMTPPTRLHGRLLIESAVPDTVLIAIGEGDVWGAVRIPLDPDGTFSATLPRGAYTIAIDADPGDSMGGVLALDRITLTNEVRWELDLPMVTVGATVTIDGAPAAAPTAGMGTLELVSIGSPVSYSIWPTPGKLPAGNYRPGFAFGSPEPPGFPQVSELPATPIAITSSTTLAFDLSTRALSGTIKLDGARRVSNATIALSGRNDGDHLGELSDGKYATRVVPGTYEVSFHDAFASAENRRPRNTRFNLGCITVK